MLSTRERKRNGIFIHMMNTKSGFVASLALFQGVSEPSRLS